MSDMEHRVAVLEKEFAEVKVLKGIPGEKGRPGNIDAALNNVEKAVPILVQDTLKNLGFVPGQIQGKAGRDGRDGRTPDAQELETILYRLLHECGILEDGGVGSLLKNEIQRMKT